MDTDHSASREDVWSLDLEVGGRSFKVRERAERTGLWLYWYQDGGRRQPRLQGLETVRRDDGSVDPQRVKKAMRLATRQFLELLDGPVGDPSVRAGDDDLTIEQGFDLALQPGTGRYASRSPRHKEVRRARDRILESLPPDLCWSELRPRHYKLIWSTFIARRKVWCQGWRMAEIAVSVLAAIGAWLLDEEYIDAFRTPKRGWRGELRNDWEEAERRPAKPARPRHTDQEMTLFWNGLDDPSLDPRCRLAAELGAEYRIGQVLRCQRSDLDLTPGAGAGYGVLKIPGKGRKPGATVFLTARQREVVDASLCHAGQTATHGHLAEYEQAFRSGTLGDYPLFPSGRLTNGRLRLPAPGRAAGQMARRNLLHFFTAYEASVGIAHAPGRAWYGIRRRSSDQMRRISSDERVRDAAGGWTPGSSTRERIYMDGQDPDVLRETASAREAARGRATDRQDRATSEDLAAILRSMGIPEARVQALLVMAVPDS